LGRLQWYIEFCFWTIQYYLYWYVYKFLRQTISLLTLFQKEYCLSRLKVSRQYLLLYLYLESSSRSDNFLQGFAACGNDLKPKEFGSFFLLKRQALQVYRQVQ